MNFIHCQGGGNFPLYPFLSSVAGLVIKLAQDRLIGETNVNFCTQRPKK